MENINVNLSGVGLQIQNADHYRDTTIAIYSSTSSNGLEWKINYGTFICAPATSKEEAINIAYSLVAQNSWLQNVKWAK